MTNQEIHDTQALSYRLGEELKAHKLVLTTAESCTGGGVASAITDIAGSSAWFDRAFVTYSNQAKQTMIGVNLTTLDRFGAVSEETVMEMASGALERSLASVSIAISGIAGPEGGSADKPVGTVCFAWLIAQQWQYVETKHFSGDRAQVRSQAVYHALSVLHDHLIQQSQEINPQV